MPETLSGLLSIGGLGWIVAAAFLAGLVRGFAGFGTALVFLPVATQTLPPFWAITAVAFMDIGGPLPNLRGAWRAADRGDLVRLLAGLVVCLPLGLWMLGLMEPDTFRWAVCLVSLAMLAVLATGLRYRGDVTGAMVVAAGAGGGFLGGVAGVPGPPVILFYMARPLPAAAIRATVLLFLFLYDLVLTVYLGLGGVLDAVPVVLGLALTLPNMAGNWLGGWLFVPGRDLLYRRSAYALIAAAALSGLPVWG